MKVSKDVQSLFDLRIILVITYIHCVSYSTCQESTTAGHSGGFTIAGPRNYTIYSGDVEVEIKVPSSIQNAQIQVMNSETGLIVHAADMLEGFTEGSAYIRCGVIDTAGVYVFKLLDFDESTIVTSSLMYASWPNFNLVLPHTHIALTTQVTLQFFFQQDLCNSLQHSTSLRLQVIYHGDEQVNTTLSTGSKGNTFRYDDEIYDLSAIRNAQKAFACDIFDLQGSYSVALISNGMDGVDITITTSNIMHVRWSQDYSLSMNANSIFPCRSYVSLSYSHPECANSEDRIRVFMRSNIADSSPASPTSLQYVSESRITRGSSRIKFDCHLFHESLPAYCFKYVSFASSGAITEQKILCVPSIAGNEAVLDGQWSGWSDWSSCTVSCGFGQSSRYRTCDNPAPTPGAKYCEGENVEWTDCNHPCTGGKSTTFSPQWTPDPDCECGCDIRSTRGQLIGVAKCRGVSIWVIRGNPGQTFQLTFSLFNLDPYNSNTWMKVRDGPTQMSSLLLYEFGGSLPKPLYSSREALMVELMMPYQPSYDTSAVFVISYVAIAHNGTYVGYPSGGSDGTVWKTIVSVLAVVIVGIIVSVIIILVCQKHNQKKDSIKVLQVNQSLLVNGEVTNSPSHSGQSPQSPNGSTNMSFKNSSSSPIRRDYVLPQSSRVTPDVIIHKGRGSHHSRNSSNSSGFRGSFGSPTSPYKSPVHSKYRPQGDVRDSPLFNASPLTERSSTSRNRDYADMSANRRSLGYDRNDRNPHIHSEYSSSDAYVKQSPKKYAKPNTAPLAGGEDLSPTSPIEYGGKQLPFTTHPYGNKNELKTITEQIPMDNQNWQPHGKREQETSFNSSPSQNDSTNTHPIIHGQRPPVEGRDSTLHRNRDTRDTGSSTTSAEIPTTPDYQNANVVNANGRPVIKPLPLRSVQRPDGQSPENRPEDHNANTPSNYSSASHELSPYLVPEKLFPNSGNGTPAEFSIDPADFEYDDYLPHLPNSYFNMDPSAYTLTWNKQNAAPHDYKSTGTSSDRKYTDGVHESAA